MPQARDETAPLAPNRYPRIAFKRAQTLDYTSEDLLLVSDHDLSCGPIQFYFVAHFLNERCLLF